MEASAITIFGLHDLKLSDHGAGVLGQTEILAALKAKGVSNAEIGRTIRKPSSRIAEMFDNRRKLQLAEAVKLVETYELDDRGIGDTPSADVLSPLLNAVLRRSQKSNVTESSVRVLAEALEYGLGLVARNPAIRTNVDALAAVGQAAADRLPSSMP